jgi:hypothetical protein
LDQRDTRIWVSLIFDLLATGMGEAELRSKHPGLVHEDILATIAYGAKAARERVVPVPRDKVASDSTLLPRFRIWSAIPAERAD